MPYPDRSLTNHFEHGVSSEVDEDTDEDIDEEIAEGTDDETKVYYTDSSSPSAITKSRSQPGELFKGRQPITVSSPQQPSQNSETTFDVKGKGKAPALPNFKKRTTMTNL